MIHTDGTPTIAHRGSTVDVGVFPDVLITREHGNAYLVQGATLAGKEYLREELSELYETDERTNPSYLVGREYIETVFDSLVDSGLIVR